MLECGRGGYLCSVEFQVAYLLSEKRSQCEVSNFSFHVDLEKE